MSRPFLSFVVEVHECLWRTNSSQSNYFTTPLCYYTLEKTCRRNREKCISITRKIDHRNDNNAYVDFSSPLSFRPPQRTMIKTPSTPKNNCKAKSPSWKWDTASSISFHKVVVRSSGHSTSGRVFVTHKSSESNYSAASLLRSIQT